MSKDFLWVEKYRPTTIDDCILPTSLKDVFNNIVKSGELPNMLFTGTAGLGKTTVAKAICKQLNLDYIIVNGSEEGNIDTLRVRLNNLLLLYHYPVDIKWLFLMRLTILIHNQPNLLFVAS